MSRIIDLNQKFETDLTLYPGLTKYSGNIWKPSEDTALLHGPGRMARLSPNRFFYINNHRPTPIDAQVDFGQRPFNSAQIFQSQTAARTCASSSGWQPSAFDSPDSPLNQSGPMEPPKSRYLERSRRRHYNNLLRYW